MANQHISCNSRLILDLLDYTQYVESDVLILFLDFYKAFDTVEHEFLFNSLQVLGFGETFISSIRMFYKIFTVVSCYIQILLRDFQSADRSAKDVTSPFPFLIVVELLSLRVLHCHHLQGLRIFEREIRMSQLVDDTVLFLKNKQQVEKTIREINLFSLASGLKLNLAKCEILSLQH